MFTLHYAPDNASLIVRLLLEELGLPYRTALVDRSTRQQDSAAYRRLNPSGLIPALETPGGPMFETGAILLWLSDTHGDGRSGPLPGSPGRGDFLKWLFFLSNTAHADLRQLFYPENYVPADAVPGHHGLMTARMKRHFSLLNAAANGLPDLFAPHSPLAFYTGVMMRWSVLYPVGQNRWFTLADCPELARMAQAVETRPAMLAAVNAEGLGPTPLTDPRYCTPTEGSVL
ncbi:MAG: glutathione S-transferase family protein [Paracoccaceae bacterium]